MALNSAVFSIVVFVLVALMLTCIVMIIATLVRPRLRPEDLPPCERVDLCTGKEQEVLADLLTICGRNELVVMAKVGFGCLIKPKKGVNNRDKWRNKLRGEYADFVVCNSTGQAMLVIMLDDSFALEKTSEGMVDRGCEQADMPILHVRDYNVPGLEKAILQKLGIKKTSRSQAQAAPAPPVAAAPQAPAAEPPAPPDAEPAAV